MKYFKIILISSMIIVSMQIQAIQFGKITLNSSQNAALDAEISVILSKDDKVEFLKASIASIENYKAQNIERLQIHNDIKVVLIPGKLNQAVLALSSKLPVSDPFLDLLIQIESPEGKTFKEYTVLLDPPTNIKSAAKLEKNTEISSKTSKSDEIKLVEKNIVKTEILPEKSKTVAIEPLKESEKKNVKAVSGKTLFQIARENYIAGITTEQIVVAIYQTNPNAFDKNINGLINGKTLQLPSKDYYEKLSHLQARKILRQENEASDKLFSDKKPEKNLKKEIKSNSANEELAELKKQLEDANKKLQEKETALKNLGREPVSQRNKSLENLENKINTKPDNKLIDNSPEIIVDNISKIDEQIIEDSLSSKAFVSSVTNQDENIIQEVIIDDEKGNSIKPIFLIALVGLFSLLLGILFFVIQKKKTINQAPFPSFSNTNTPENNFINNVSKEGTLTNKSYPSDTLSNQDHTSSLNIDNEEKSKTNNEDDVTRF